MGMAASQGRLLQLTSRKNSIGLQLTRLSNEKMSLTREMQKVSSNYQESISAKTLKWSDNGGVSYVDLSYSNLMTPSAMNKMDPYVITDSNGRVVIASNYEEYAKMISPDGRMGGDYQSNRSQILSELVGVSAADLDNYDKLSAITETSDAKIASLQEEVNKLYNKSVKEGPLEEFLGIFGSSFQGVSNANTITNAASIQEDFKNSNGERCWILTEDLGSSKETVKSMLDQICNTVCASLFDEDAAAFKEACETTLSQYNNYLDTAGVQCGDKCNASKDNKGSAAGKYIINIKLFIEALMRNYEASGGKVSTSNGGNTRYQWVDKNSDSYKNYEAKKAELEAAKAECNDAKKQKASAFDADTERKIAFYDAIFTAIAEKGWVKNSKVTDTDYLNEMMQNGLYSLTTMEKSLYTDGQNDDGTAQFRYEYTTDIAENNKHVYKVNDSDIHNEALVEYEYQKSIINAKETRIDTRMKDLQTEQSAIQQMIQGIEQVKNDNVERTFSIFS